MNEIKKLVIVFAIGAILGAGICGGLIYRSGARRIDEIGGELDSANRTNQQLTERLAEREAVVDKLTESIDTRQGIIDAARRELESSKSSVAKIRALLELLRDSK
jgi:hypothetical protein